MKFLFKAFLFFLALSMIGTCFGAGDTDSNTSEVKNEPVHTPTSKPSPTPMETIYDEVYYNRYGGGYSSYLFFDFDNNVGMEVTYYHTHRGKKPSKWGSYDYFTFTGNFDDGLYIQECGSDKQRQWVWNDKKNGYIVPKDEWGLTHVDTHSRVGLTNAIVEARNHGVNDRRGCE